MTVPKAVHCCSLCVFTTSEAILADPNIAYGGEAVLRERIAKGWRPLADRPGHWVQQCPDCFREDFGLDPMTQRTPNRAILAYLSKLPDDAWTLGLDMVKQSLHPLLARGTVYVWLGQLEEDGYVRSRPASMRYEYQITSAGRAALLRDDL